MTIHVYPRGKMVRVSFTFLNDADEFADPSTVRFRVTRPMDGVTTTYQYPADAQIVKTGAGQFHVDLETLEVNADRNTYYFQAEGTGNGIEFVEHHLYKVESSAFVEAAP